MTGFNPIADIFSETFGDPCAPSTHLRKGDDEDNNVAGLIEAVRTLATPGVSFHYCRAKHLLDNPEFRGQIVFIGDLPDYLKLLKENSGRQYPVEIVWRRDEQVSILRKKLQASQDSTDVKPASPSL